nr:methyltransferase [Candidatus Sigynarchaeota archaeon]
MTRGNDDESFQHYFSRRHRGEVRKRTISLHVGGVSFTFSTVSGTFSKGKIDTGTMVMLDEFNRHERPEGKSILDLGCGYGAVGIIVGKANPGNQIAFLDINEDAIKVSRENVKINKLEHASFHLMDFQDASAIRDASLGLFDYILFNPPVRAGLAAMERLTVNALACLHARGSLYMVIKTSLGAGRWQSWLSEQEGFTVETFKKSGYRVFKITRDGSS